jgi:hypothetical protein
MPVYEMLTKSISPALEFDGGGCKNIIRLPVSQKLKSTRLPWRADSKKYSPTVPTRKVCLY